MFPQQCFLVCLGLKCRENQLAFYILLDKLDCLFEMGILFLQENQIDRAVDSFKSVLEQAKKMYAGQPRVAVILNDLGAAVKRAGMSDEALRCFKEAKEILDGHSQEGPHISIILNNIGTIYKEYGDLLVAFQFYKDALDCLDIFSCKYYSRLCKNIAAVVRGLYVEGTIRRRPFSRIKELKTVEISGQIYIPSTEGTCSDDVSTFYQISLFCIDRGKQDGVLQCLAKARDIAKRFDYKCGRVVLVLLLLSMTYGEMGSIEESRSCYKEAKEMTKSLPPEDDSILPGELGMIELMKKE